MAAEPLPTYFLQTRYLFVLMLLHSDHETLLWLLTRCFLGCKGSASVGPVLCQQWLLELMGHAKALATGLTAVPEGCQLAQVNSSTTRRKRDAGKHGI